MTPSAPYAVFSPTAEQLPLLTPHNEQASQGQGTGCEAARIFRFTTAGTAQAVTDDLALEEPLEIQLETRSISVTMRTPGHDAELAIGFLLSEGLIRKPQDVLAINKYDRNENGNVIGVFLRPELKVDVPRLTRHVFASASCGLCGKTTIDAVHQHFHPVSARFSVAAEVLLQLPGRLHKAQQTFHRTGALHGAALFSAEGSLLVLREDIGRHNAVDKVLGYSLLKNLLPLDRHILLVSGRSSFEIMQKALAAGIPIVAAVSAPTSLAVQFANASGQTLIGFLRDHRMNIYSEPARIRFSV